MACTWNIRGSGLVVVVWFADKVITCAPVDFYGTSLIVTSHLVSLTIVG